MKNSQYNGVINYLDTSSFQLYPRQKEITVSTSHPESQSKSRAQQMIAVLVIVVIVVGIGILLTAQDETQPLDQSVVDIRTLEAGRTRGTGGMSQADAMARYEVDPVLGPTNAPVTILEYGAFGCPSCRQFHQLGIIERLLADFEGQVNFVFRDFPVTVPSYDRRAAEVAQCALDQSNEAFWTLHDTFYTHVEVGASTDELIGWGTAIGLDEDALRACVESGIHKATVEYDLERGLALALPGTPSFLVNNQRVFSPGEQALRAAVEQALDAS